MRSVPEFFLIALLVTLTPGPATALMLRVAARDGRRAAMGAVMATAVALTVALVIVAYDVLWFGLLIWAVDRASTILRPRVRRSAERVTGGVMIGLGVSLAAEAR